MKQIMIMMIACAGFVSCNDAAKQFSERNAGADSIAINFFKEDGRMDTVASVKIIRDKKSIEQMVSLIASSTATLNNTCAYEGSIHFFKNDRVVQDVFFSSTEGCSRFLFRVDGKDAATKLDDNAKQFLSAQKNK